jgi:hypothetical protein
MQPNIPLFQKVMDHITAHPEEHDQGTWGWATVTNGTPCGTAFCVAGTIASWSTTHRLVWEYADPEAFGSRSEAVLTCVVPITDTETPDLVESGHYDEPDGSRRPDWLLSIPDLARKELGIEDANYLFSGSNTLHELWWIANRLCGGVLVVPEEYQGNPYDGENPW